MLKPLSVLTVAAAALCFAAAAYAGPGPQTEDKDEPPKPRRRYRRTFPSTRTWSLRELNGKPVPPRSRRQPEDRRHAARLWIHRLQFLFGDDVSDQTISTSPVNQRRPPPDPSE